jgi:16S rRNA (cytosine967-C5)-methyltransferase
VLRRIAAEGRDILNSLDGPRLNTPDWLWTSWTEAWGRSKPAAIAGATK